MRLDLRIQKVVSWLVRTNLIMLGILRVHFAVIDMLKQFGRFHQMPSIKRTNCIANHLRFHGKVEFLRRLLLYRRLLHFRDLLLYSGAITRLISSFLLLFLHVYSNSVTSSGSQPQILRVHTGIQITAFEGIAIILIMAKVKALIMAHISIAETVIMIVSLILIIVRIGLLVLPSSLDSIIVMRAGVIRSITLVVIPLIVASFRVFLIPGLLEAGVMVWVDGIISR